MIHSKGAAERRRSLALGNLRGKGKLKVDGEKRDFSDFREVERHKIKSNCIWT